MKLHSKFLSRLCGLTLTALALGCATAQAAPVVLLNPGTTQVTFDPGFLAAATSLQVSISRVSPASLAASGNIVRATFPIASSAAFLDVANAKAEILHTGGLRLTAGQTEVRLTNYAIDTAGTTPVLTGLVWRNGSLVGRATLFDLTLPALTLPLAPTVTRDRLTGKLVKSVRLPGVGVRLTAGAASLLNSSFGVTAFTGGLNIGTATVSARTP